MGRSSLNAKVTNKVKKDVHIFVDKDGNVEQIEKKEKDRLKYYIDPTYSDMVLDYCAIGINDEESGECSYGIAMGVGDNLMAYAKYF